MIDKINDTYLVYSFIKRLVKPFASWDAYKTGVIDQHGNILVDVKHRTEKQKRSFGIFDLMVLNMKKILGKLPGGNSTFATYTAALFLIKEDKDNFTENEFKKFMTELSEEVTNSTAGGHIAGINRDDAFMGSKVFKVNSDTIEKNRQQRKKYSRYKKYVGGDPVGEEIKNYAIKNPKKDIALQDNRTNEIVFLRRRKIDA